MYSQVKIGDNPASIDNNSILELQSAEKVLVITRMSTLVMNSITPLPGALVYNTTDDCIYSFDGTIWNSLCETSSTTSNINVTTSTTAPTNNTEGDFWINNSNSNNTVSIWDGVSWVSIDNNPRTGNGIPSTVTAPNPNSGQIYVNEATGEIYAYDGTTWINSNATLTANNGITINNGEIQLGGLLTIPTVIETNTNNTLAITGLEDGNITDDDILTINKTTGVLRKVSASNLFNFTEEVTEIIASDGQVQFSPDSDIIDPTKVNVYRNGVRIDFTVIDTATIEIEPEAICYAGDQIRIVQFF